MVRDQPGHTGQGPNKPNKLEYNLSQKKLARTPTASLLINHWVCNAKLMKAALGCGRGAGLDYWLEPGGG